MLVRMSDCEEEPEGSKPKSSLRSTTSVNSNKSAILRKDVIPEVELPSSIRNGRTPWNSSKMLPDFAPIERSSSRANCDSDGELIGMLSKHLYLAESQMQRMQKVLAKAEERLKSKEQEIGRLKRKVKDWEMKSKNQTLIHKKELQQKRAQIEDSEYLYRRCLLLEHKIYEMEKFLADYGLVWVGDADDENNSLQSMPKDYIESCYAQLMTNIEELNLSVGKGEVHIQQKQNGAGASFKTSSCMSLKFYKNGMVVQDGPLRNYDDPKTGSFIRDILDGYFPSELQKFYPNGVPLKVGDHRTEIYYSQGNFPGQGYRLGKRSLIKKSSPRISPRQISSPASTSRTSEISKWKQSSTDFVSKNVSDKARQAKIYTQISSTRMTNLRSQILASHNNNCSDSHLQSHINAELALSSRKEKRDLATKCTEYRGSTNEKITRTSTPRSNTPRVPDSSSTSWHSYKNNSPVRTTPRARSRSVSSASPRPNLRSMSEMEYPLANNVKNLKENVKQSFGYRIPRVSKSATLDRRNDEPFIRQINGPTGKGGELRLKVRSLNGCTVYLVHVSADDTVAKLYQILDRNLPNDHSRGYKVVISGYVPKRLEQLAVTLREYGIFRDSVLHLVND